MIEIVYHKNRENANVCSEIDELAVSCAASVRRQAELLRGFSRIGGNYYEFYAYTIIANQ